MAAAFLAMAGAEAADYRDWVGYVQLQTEYGGALPTASGAQVTQVEAPDGSSNYFPDTTDPEFAGRTFTAKSGESGHSPHATTVGYTYYGNSSLAPGVTSIFVYNANSWIGSGFLRTGTSFSPLTETSLAQCNAWIGTTGNTATDDEILARLDYAITTSKVLSAVGVNNGASNSLPVLMAQGYNSIAVGLTNGDHTAGTTTVATAGRTKPDIVAPDIATSYATGKVASAITLLRSTADGNASLSKTAGNASRPETTKAFLLAGATKGECSNWSNTATQPLDSRYGAGQLNIYNSYKILVAAEQDPYETTAASVPAAWGWDNGRVGVSTTRHYYFDVPTGYHMKDLSIALSWNRDVTITGGTPSTTVADFSLRLCRGDGYVVGTELASSNSAVDNVEHIWRTAPLGPGRYVIQVTRSASGGATNVNYGLAWRATVSNVPTTYAAWQAQELSGVSAADQEALADPDGDGLKNLLEYAYGSSPTSAASAAYPGAGAATEADSKYLTIAYRRRTGATDLTYTVGTSGDMATWDESGGTVQTVSTTADGTGFERVTVRRTSTVSEAPQFLRVRVTSN